MWYIKFQLSDWTDQNCSINRLCATYFYFLFKILSQSFKWRETNYGEPKREQLGYWVYLPWIGSKIRGNKVRIGYTKEDQWSGWSSFSSICHYIYIFICVWRSLSIWFPPLIRVTNEEKIIYITPRELELLLLIPHPDSLWRLLLPFERTLSNQTWYQERIGVNLICKLQMPPPFSSTIDW